MEFLRSTGIKNLRVSFRVVDARTIPTMFIIYIPE
jgi:hypothetical protein